MNCESTPDEVNTSPRPVAPPVHSEASGSARAPFDSGAGWSTADEVDEAPL